jgi:hypothetical protein
MQRAFRQWQPATPLVTLALTAACFERTGFHAVRSEAELCPPRCEPAECDATSPCTLGQTCAGGTCLLDNGQLGCTSNAQCLNVCIGDVCSDLAGTNGGCDEPADCQSGHTCSAGECLLVNGQSGCGADSECVGTCITGTCANLSTTNGACDDGLDCGAGLSCSAGECLLDNGQTGCTNNSQCASVCVIGTCADVSATNGACDESPDCLSGHTCSDGECLLDNGQAGCSANTQCLGTCIFGTCNDLSTTNGDCDEAADCGTGHTCSANACLLENGQTGCSTNDHCLNVCINGTCGDVSSTLEACDETLDCGSGHTCSGIQCRLDTGETGCTANNQCVAVCIFGTCDELSSTGGTCDESADCVSGHSCSGTCLVDGAQTGWSALEVGGAPSPRHQHTAVWTGSSMIVWGGTNGTSFMDSGGRYDPVNDSWTPTSTLSAPTPRSKHTAVWTGSRMLVWGGTSATGAVRSGALYDPTADTWSPISELNAPGTRFDHTAVWTGSMMIVWGGNNGFGAWDTGGRYDPVADVWSPVAETFATPTARSRHAAVFAGTMMIVHGGMNDAGGALSDLYRYSPAGDTWAPGSAVDAPLSRGGHG